jgi:hypothetical protein
MAEYPMINRRVEMGAKFIRSKPDGKAAKWIKSIRTHFHTTIYAAISIRNAVADGSGKAASKLRPANVIPARPRYVDT